MRENPQATMRISQRENQYGTLEPQIEIRLAKGAHHRMVSATLHKLAADVELATPVRENWIVQTWGSRRGTGCSAARSRAPEGFWATAFVRGLQGGMGERFPRRQCSLSRT